MDRRPLSGAGKCDRLGKVDTLPSPLCRRPSSRMAAILIDDGSVCTVACWRTSFIIPWSRSDDRGILIRSPAGLLPPRSRLPTISPVPDAEVPDAALEWHRPPPSAAGGRAV
jgi:hypothetical protein